MSATLKWRPATQGRTLPDALRFALERSERSKSQTVFDAADIPYFQGPADAGVDGAKSILEAIDKHDVVELFNCY